MTDFGPSWLSCLPDGATVTRREVTQYTVAALGDEHISARPAGRRRLEYFDTRMIPDSDAPLVAVGARFWLASERVAGHPGEAYSALAFRRPDAATAEQAFAARTQPRTPVPSPSAPTEE